MMLQTQIARSPTKELLSAVIGKNPRRSFHLLVGVMLTLGSGLVGELVARSVTNDNSWWSRLSLIAIGILVTFLYLRWQLRSEEESPDVIKERVSQLQSELRTQVRSRSYGARSRLIEAPLKELDLNITPRVGLVRDPRLKKPRPISEGTEDDIVATFESSNRRLLIVGEPGSGKSMTAYSLIEYLDEREGDERVPLLVEVSAWEAQDDLETFLVDYLCSLVGYQVRQRADASAFLKSQQYHLILDGLDEIPAGLRTHFSERLNEFARGLPSEVGVVVTCRTQEYKELLAAHPTGLGLVQAVEMLPLSDGQLDSAFIELANRDEEWESFLPQRHLRSNQRVRDLLSNPLFLNLAAVGHLSPGELLDFTTTEQELQDFVLDRYLDRTLESHSQANQKHYEPEAARRYLSWVARFLNGVEVSPFGLKTSDFTVLDLANLTPPTPPRGYRLFAGLGFGLLLGLVETRPTLLSSRTPTEAMSRSLRTALLYVLITTLLFGLLFGPGIWTLSFVDEKLPGVLQILIFALFLGPVSGMLLGLNNGGWFVLLQRVAHRRLARAGNLPPRPYDFLEWGVETQLFRRVGGGVRFRHNLIQQHLASTSADA